MRRPWRDSRVASTARARRCFSIPSPPAPASPRGCSALSTARWPQLPIPKVMQYQLADGWTSVSFVRPAHGLVALHGSEVVPVRALGLAAGRVTQGHRFEGEPHADRAERRGRLRDATARRRRGDRELRRTARRDQTTAERGRRRGAPRADRRRRAARRSDGAGRAAERAHLPVRSRVPRRAAGVPGPDDEGEPEVLSAARGRRPPHRTLPRRQQHHAGRPSPDRRRQRARRPAAPRRCQVLLRPGPQAHARIARSRTRQGRLSRQARQPGRPRAARAPDRCLGRRADRRRSGARRPRRAARQGRPADRHGRRIPRAAGDHGRLLRGARRRGARGRRGGPRAVRQPAWRQRRDGDPPRRRGAADRRSSREPGRHLGHRPQAHRRQGPLRTASPRADADRLVPARRRRRSDDAIGSARSARAGRGDIHGAARRRRRRARSRRSSTSAISSSSRRFTTRAPSMP